MTSEPNQMRWYDWLIPALLPAVGGLTVSGRWIFASARAQRKFAADEVTLHSLASWILDLGSRLGESWWLVMPVMLLVCVAYVMFYRRIGGWQRPVGQVLLAVGLVAVFAFAGVIGWALGEPGLSVYDD